MYATLADTNGNRMEVEILDAQFTTMDRGASESAVLRTFTIESPWPVATPGQFLLEFETGAFEEVRVVVCEALPDHRYFLMAVRRLAVPQMAMS